MSFGVKTKKKLGIRGLSKRGFHIQYSRTDFSHVSTMCSL